MRAAHDAAEHDRWFRSEVQKTIDGVAAGTVGFISDEEHRPDGSASALNCKRD
jgi:hypothetical protein